MKNSSTPYIVVGRFGRPYGVHGWIRVHAYTEQYATILSFKPWYLKQHNQWQPVSIEDGRTHGKSIIVKLEDVNTPEKARLLTGTDIAVLRAQLPELKENEYYWSDLVGLTVIDQYHNTLGTVINLMATGSNDVLLVKGKKEVVIPWLPDEVIKQVDLEKQEIHVDWER